MSTVAADSKSPVYGTVFTVLFAIAFCHTLNDMMQSMLVAIYPNLKRTFDLDFTHIGLVTLTFQLTASLLQPLVGFYTDKRALPFALPAAMVFTFAGLLLLAWAPSYPLLLLAAGTVGVGSSVFHPESSRVVHMAAGQRRGLAQAMFQTGGNVGQAIGPLAAALLVSSTERSGIAWFSLAALLAIAILTAVGLWYRNHGLARASHANRRTHVDVPPGKVKLAAGILVALMFSKFFYMSSIGSYFTFYLIHKFHVSVPQAQFHLSLFLGAVAVGTISGGPLGDWFGRKHLIWFSILGTLPFALALPYANLFWTSVLSVCAGLTLASAFPAMVVYGQEMLPGRVGMISGMFFGFSFGLGGLGAALLGVLADHTSIDFVYKVCAFLPAIGLLAAFLPNLKHQPPSSA
ncbi:MAG TPA: MFS transporter [Rhizomicrobium sp.]|jgi:FSR family fosmidomycin resistance protein-like MFS transporter|nr:MFS transporter [Rhizomicrobium sp.]